MQKLALLPVIIPPKNMIWNSLSVSALKNQWLVDCRQANAEKVIICTCTDEARRDG
jgi:hypothetical protein